MRLVIQTFIAVILFWLSLAEQTAHANPQYPLTLLKLNDQGSFLIRFADPMTGSEEQFRLSRIERSEEGYFEYRVEELPELPMETNLGDAMTFLESKTLLLSEDMIREVLMELRSAAVEERSTFEFDAQGVFKKSPKQVRLDWNRSADAEPVIRRLMTSSLIAGAGITMFILPQLTQETLTQSQSLKESMISGLGVAGAAGVSIFGGPFLWVAALYNRSWGPKLAFEFSKGRFSDPIKQIAVSGLASGGIGFGMITCASMIAKAAAGHP